MRERNITFDVCTNGSLRMYNPNGEVICRVITIPDSLKELVTKSVLLHGEPYGESVHNPKLKLKTRYKWFTEKHQITPSNALKVLRGYVSNEITKKYPHWFAVVRGSRFVGLHSSKLDMIAFEPDAEQAVKDGIKNIAPLIIALQKTPKELKEYLGKGLWKSLCKNSYTRNLLIARNYIRSLDHRAGTSEDKIELISTLNKFPSTIISQRQVIDFNKIGLYCVKVLKEQFKIPYCKINTGNNHRIRNEVTNTVRDTIYELKQDGANVSLDWSYRRFKEEHDKLLATRKDRYRKQEEARQEKFKALKLINIKTLHKKFDTIELNGAVATPLTSFDAVRQEGDEMHHCVGSYAERCANGDYLVYSITGADGVRSTLGINAEVERISHWPIGKAEPEMIEVSRKYSFNQHYVAWNQPVTDENVLTLANKVVEYLNS